jgi:hypothetical protein
MPPTARVVVQEIGNPITLIVIVAIRCPDATKPAAIGALILTWAGAVCGRYCFRLVKYCGDQYDGLEQDQRENHFACFRHCLMFHFRLLSLVMTHWERWRQSRRCAQNRILNCFSYLTELSSSLTISRNVAAGTAPSTLRLLTNNVGVPSTP